MTRRAILWRHGRTAWNRANRFQGQLDVPLDEGGLVQAGTAAGVLAIQNPGLIVASDLSRAAATAAALVAVTGQPAVPDPDLREANAGSWEGLTHAEIIERDGDLLELWRGSADVRPGGTGETRSEVGSRVAGAIRRHMATVEAPATVVFVTHGGAARAAVGHLLGLDALQWQRMAVLRNCAWAVLEVDQRDAWRLDAYNIGVATPGVAEPAASVRDGIV